MSLISSNQPRIYLWRLNEMIYQIKMSKEDFSLLCRQNNFSNIDLFIAFSIGKYELNVIHFYKKKKMLLPSIKLNSVSATVLKNQNIETLIRGKVIFRKWKRTNWYKITVNGLLLRKMWNSYLFSEYIFYFWINFWKSCQLSSHISCISDWWEK